MLKFHFFVLFTLFVSFCSGQSAMYIKLVDKADSLYKAKDYKNSAWTYSEAFKSNGGKAYPSDRYNAACSWALAGEADSAFFNLKRIAEKSQYSNFNHISTDTDLTTLHTDKRWKSVLKMVKKNKAKLEKNYNTKLVEQLAEIQNDDQNGRQQLRDVETKYGRDSKELKDLWKTIHEKDSLNLIKVQQILDKYGWLGADKVGAEGNQTLFLVIQHSDLAVQEKYLPMMRKAVKDKRANSSSLALLEDRVALRQGKLQIYGSQIGRDESGAYYVFAIEDPDNVDKRRAEVGLPPIADYVSHWDMKWDLEQYKKDYDVILEKTKKVHQ